MKHVFFLWILILGLNSVVVAQKISLSVKNATLDQVFEQVTKKTGYDFLYNTQLLENTGKLTFSIRNASIEEILDMCLQDQDLDYAITANTIVLKPKRNVSMGQENTGTALPLPPSHIPFTLAGKVFDSDGQTLPGAFIRKQGSSSGVLSDSDGEFSISVLETDRLTVSFLGYETRDILVGDNTIMDITLVPKLTNLDEAIVVGYGTVTKRDVTGSIASITSKEIQERSPTNIYDSIQGQSSGVQVDQSDGRPGAQSSVTIRGIATLGAGAAPLYIVDGAQGVNIDGINPLDVERIEILKDAASAAIYGSRGANGVVIITTKRGREGLSQVQGTFINTLGKLAHKIPQATAADRRIYERKIFGAGGGLPADSLNPGFNADNDYLDILTRTAVRTEANLSLGSGTKLLRYYLGGQYQSDKGIIKNSWANIARLRLNTDFTPNNKFSVSNSLAFSFRNENLINEVRVLNEGLSRIPTYALYFPDGSFAPMISGRYNPLAFALLNQNINKAYDANLASKVSYKFNSHLTLSADATVRYFHSRQIQFTPRLLNATSTNTAGFLNSGIDASRLDNYWLGQSYLNYDQKLGADHTITAVAGVSAEKSFTREERITAQDFLSERVISFNSAQIVTAYNPSERQSTAISGFGRIGYNYKGKYQLSASLRADASSRFGKDNRWGYFPSAGAAWLISSEPFMTWSKAVATDVKLRGSYGVTGNDRIGEYDAIQRYTFGTQYYNGVSGVAINTRFGNNQLGWETNKQLDLGLDLTFLEGRASFSIGYYSKITSDLLYTAPMVIETGFADVNVNIGSIQNRGIELQASGYPTRKANFRWNVAGNISFNRGKVRQLLNGTPILAGAGSLTEEGQPLGNFYGWTNLGVYSYNESNAYDENWNQLTPVFDGTTFNGYTLNGQAYSGIIRRRHTNGVTSVGGDVIWEDLDNNGIIDDADRKVLGNAQAKYVASLTNTLEYKDFSFSFNWYANIGGKIYNSVLASLSSYNSSGSTPPPWMIYAAWDQPGDVTMVPDPKIGSSVGNTRAISSRYIEDGSFIRLRNVRLTYNMPVKFSHYVGARKLSIYLAGNNLMTFSNYSWFDPEMSQFNPLLLGVEAFSRIPRKREILFGLNLVF